MSRRRLNLIRLEPRCYFCGKYETEAQKLVLGLDASICHDCVDLFTKSFAKKKEEKPKPKCSFCHADHRDLIAGQEARICNNCIELCNKIINERIQTGKTASLS